MTTEPDGLVEKLRERAGKWETAADLSILLSKAADALSAAQLEIRETADGAFVRENALRKSLLCKIATLEDALSAAQRSNVALRELWQTIRQTQGQIVPVLNDEMIPVSVALQWADKLVALLSERSPTKDQCPKCGHAPLSKTNRGLWYCPQPPEGCGEYEGQG